MLFNCALEYGVRRAEVNQDGLKLNGTHQILVYADDVNILGGNIHSTKRNKVFLISSFPRVLYVVCFLLGNYPACGFYIPMFRNTLSVPSS